MYAQEKQFFIRSPTFPLAHELTIRIYNGVDLSFQCCPVMITSVSWNEIKFSGARVMNDAKVCAVC